MVLKFICRTIKIAFAIALLLANNICNSQTSLLEQNKPWKKKPFERKAFIENKGQFDFELPLDKKNFNYVFDNGIRVFFYKNEVVFYLSKSSLSNKELMEEATDEAEERERELLAHKKNKEFITLKWLNSNPSATIDIIDEQSVDYAYVIKKADSEGTTIHCKGYSKLKINNLYEGVDVEYFFDEREGFKYNLLVGANVDIKEITQCYSGAKELKLIDGNIVIKTINGDIVDHAPISKTASTSQSIPSSFTLKKNTVTFNVNCASNEAIIIDPWVKVPTFTGAGVDNGVDQYGNTYVTNAHYMLEKYSPAGTLISSTDVMGGDATYYGDMLTDSRGYCFFNTVGFHPRGDASAVDSAGNFLWDSQGITECWRFVLNECTHQVLSLTGYRHSATGFAKINTQTGALVGYTQSGACCQDPHCGAIDYNGDVYCVASENAGGTSIYKWTPSNTIATTYPAVGSWGYGTGYVGDGFFSQGYNGMTILGNNLYIYDGATLFKVNKTNGSIVNQVTVPNGVNKQNGGIYITSCGKIFVGSGNGVYMYDNSFNQLDFKSTTGAVYDLAFNAFNQTISACGPGHVTSLNFVIPSCTFQTQPFIQASCNGGANGYIKLNLTGGVPDYTYTWSSNGVPISQTTDSIGGLLPGSYKCVYADNKCPVPDVDSIVITVPSVITTTNFTSQNVCFPQPTPFTDSSSTSTGTIISWSWQFGDDSTSAQQNVSHAYNSDSLYNVKLFITTSNGCKDSVTKPVRVYPKPHASYTHTDKCDGTAIPFISTSTINANGTLSTWNWNFGDNNTGTGTSASHLYSAAGNYTTTLIVNSLDGCSDTVTNQISVFNNPSASFTHLDVCLGDSMVFTNTSVVNTPATISNYLWNFGSGGATSTQQDAKYKYSLPGVYNVILVTTTSDGCSDAASATVKVYAAPATHFSVNNVCLINSASFINSSTNPALDSIGSWTWNFGDGSSNTSQWSTHHLYADTGKYYVSLITRTAVLGCADTLKDSILVFPMPLAAFTSTDVCLNDFMLFNSTSTVSGSSSIVLWNWSFGDGSPTNTHQAPGHLYTTNNTFNVTLIVGTDHSCKDTVNHSVKVHPNPLAAYTNSNVCDGTSMVFTDVSSIATTDTIVGWKWDFGDGSAQSTIQNTTHLFGSPGTDSVTLTVQSQFGCKDSIKRGVVINPNPIVNFSGIDSVGCEPLCVNFHDLTTIVSGTNISWMWSLGVNSQTSSNENPIYCYNNDSVFAPVYYTVSLTVTSDSGCTGTHTKNNYITVYPKPIAHFIAEPPTASIVNPIVSIINQSVGANQWTWNLGDGDTTSQQNIGAHTYIDTGSYIITLHTTTNYGCVDSTYETVFIEPSFLIYIPNSFSPNGDGVNDTFFPTGTFIKDIEMSIYDRWGNLAYKTNNMFKPWDGKANEGNEASQQDVYVYLIKALDYMGKQHVYRGTVTLIR